MKFEEILPKMRDEGKIGKVGEYLFKLSEYGLVWKKSHSSWTRHPRMLEDFLERDDWSLESMKVKKWRWVFGRDETMLYLTELFFSENKAEYFRIERGFAWKHPIPQTYIEEEEE